MAYFDPLPSRDERLFQPLSKKATVVIIGLGPVGLMAALLLANHDVCSTIVERHRFRLGQPKAHAINARSLEILRQVGFDVAALRRRGVPAEEGNTVRFMTTMLGDEIGSLPYERQDAAVRTITPEPLFNIAQTELEETLQEMVLASGKVTIHRHHDWEDYGYDDIKDLLISKVRNRDSGALSIIESSFIIGADGISSTVRSKMSNVEWVPIDPTYTTRNYVSIHCTVDLNSLNDGNITQLYFFCAPETQHSGFIGYGNPNWVYARPAPNLTAKDIAHFTKKRCKEEIYTAVGKELPCKLHSVQIWATSPKVATAFSDPKQRVFLAGDSAHSFPPMGGLGVNTGISDVHNLVWKLKFALRQAPLGGRSLLASYTTERKPVAVANAVQSAVNEVHMRELDAEASMITKEAKANGSLTLKKEILKAPLAAERMRRAIEKNKDHFNSLGLQLGYVYGESEFAKLSSERLTADCATYEPSFHVGARLPHTWLPDGRSTLDLVSYTNFTLFTSDKDSESWLEGGDYPVTVVDARTEPLPSDWVEAAGLCKTCALLVRPDQHILGHCTRGSEVFELIRRFTAM